MKKIVFVTQNPNKLEDAQKLMPEYEIDHIDFEVPEIQSLDQKEIIEYKLRFAYEKNQKPCFVMDTSLSFSCLNGFPGPFIKWFYSKTVGAEKTCAIANLFNDPKCTWTTMLGYHDGTEEIFLEETVNGKIATKPRGTNGYEWDVIFIPDGDTRTLAEMTFEEKQSFAVTKKLLQRFDELLKSRNT